MLQENFIKLSLSFVDGVLKYSNKHLENKNEDIPSYNLDNFRQSDSMK